MREVVEVGGLLAILFFLWGVMEGYGSVGVRMFGYCTGTDG